MASVWWVALLVALGYVALVAGIAAGLWIGVERLERRRRR